jgi:hypothetical protein
MASEVSTRSRHTVGVLIGLVIVLLAAGGWVSWVGTRDQGPTVAETAPEPPLPSGPVIRIELPHADLELPP